MELLKFTPGLVGGHCIGVDPYYFTYKAEQLGYHSQIILAGRKINDDMGKYVASNIIKKMIHAKQDVSKAKVAIMGLTFKEDCGDVRNTRVIDIIDELKDYEIDVVVHDPMADKEEVKREYGIDLVDKSEIKDVDAIVVAVGHQLFSNYNLDNFDKLYKNPNKKVLIDIKEILDRDEATNRGYHYWSL